MQTKILHFSISAFAILSISLLFFAKPTKSDPQTNLLVTACSRYNATNVTAFYANRNETFSDIQSKLRTSNFATAANAHISDPVYALFQCRDYLSRSDCLKCFDTASKQIRNCSVANGARSIYDGCFLRYESNNFYSQSTQPGNSGFCGNRTVSRESGFTQTADDLLSDLAKATPKIAGYWAAVTRNVTGGTVLYGVAQCALTVSESGCSSCLSVAYTNINRCPPFSNGSTIDAGCFLRYSTSAFFSVNQTVDIGPYLKGDSNKKKAIIGGVVGGVAFLIILALIWFLFLRPSKARRPRKGDILGATELRGPVNFHYRDLKSATKNFSEENKLGGGGFGDVYKGTLKNGKIVAVKKLVIGQSDRAKADFESEAKLISNVHHRNLIRLLGCCKKGSDLLLVYEYMENGSLDKYLFGEKSGTLSWRQRFDVILGMARGLAYLHEEFHACIIHRDIKASNVLIDDEFQPKIADFGLARLLPEDKSHLNTNFAGTLGYTAPEYAIHGQLSEKVDTYSYGVVVLEIISGLRSTDMNREPARQYLLEWAWNLYERNMLMELIDVNLDPNKYDTREVQRVAELALLCTQASVVSRPTMSEVVVSLLNRGDAGHELVRPNFVDVTKDVNGDGSYNGSPPPHSSVSVSFSAR